MDPATGYSANEGSFKMAYFGSSFDFKQLLNEGGSLETGKGCGGLRKIQWPSSKSISFSQTQIWNIFKLQVELEVV